MQRRHAPVLVEASTATRRNLLVDYYDRIQDAIAQSVDTPDARQDPGNFAPAFAVPELCGEIAQFFAPAKASWLDVGEYRGHRLTLLDLAANPGTNTTKTFPSLLIVARAIEHIRRTGSTVVIFSPTSANKGTALRDAVLRALDLKLATPEQLRVVTLAPDSGAAKLRRSRLAEDPHLRSLNPMFVYTGSDPEGVKHAGREFVERFAKKLHDRDGTNLWFSLELQNYLLADVARAFFEQDVAPADVSRPRTHAHAVSSAFGLLGYHLGRSLLEESGEVTSASRPASLLVQHLGAPDMVLSLRHGSFDRSHIPAFQHDPVSGLRVQSADRRFPFTTDDPDEILDPTFYTHRPVTSARMNEIIHRFGGDGIVVSLTECIQRYPVIRSWLQSTDRPLPADLRTVREWSTVMAFTGTLEAIDRGLVEEGHDVVVHGSGWYSTADFTELPAELTTRFSTVDDLAAAFSL
ncbi:DUF6002 family protein [Kribbella sp. NPDC051718]|uniref:DUF6002 family protein n=1 Tax=Kribbella sp. NPDC051718 TaxID=3155168 RepID=UPI003439537D